MAIIDVQLQTITPSNAIRLLSTNHQNRVLNKKRVNKYANDMGSGVWKETGQGITIYREPNPPHNEYLQDGQTRLYGIVESGKAIRMIVAYTNEPVFDVLDIGQARTLTQMLGIHFKGQANSTWLATTATALAIKDILVPNGSDAYRADSKANKIQRIAENFGAYELAAPIIREGYNHCRITGPAGHIAAMLKIAETEDDRTVQDFFFRVAIGEDIKVGMPEYALRESLIQRKFSIRDKEKANTTEGVHLNWFESAIRAWNSFVRNEPMQNARAMGQIPSILSLGGNVIQLPERYRERPNIHGAATRLAERRNKKQANS